MKDEEIDGLKNALKKGKTPCNEHGSWGNFQHQRRRQDGKYLPWGKDWHSRHEDALVTTYYDDNLVLDMKHAIQTMKGDSVITPINTN